MALFLTGATGYLGSYVANGLLRNHTDRLALLVRAKSVDEAHQRLWKSLQLHMSFEEFSHWMNSRVDIFLGDLTEPALGIEPAARQRLVKSMDSVIHCAASLNRKSEKMCLNVNLRGTLSVIKLAREAQDDHGLRRFSDVSTVAVAGIRQNEIVLEDKMIDWARSDYDPYARTKKFCEQMVHELLPDVPHTIFRPSIVLGDSRFPQTTQFDMVRAFVYLVRIPVLPFSDTWRADIVPANYVARAIVEIHQKEKPKYASYNLSSGKAALSYSEIVKAVKSNSQFVPMLEKPASWLIDTLASTPRALGISPIATLLKVFYPYLTFNTVFDNSHVVEELGEAPETFDRYALGLFQFAKDGSFTYPYKPWPGKLQISKVA